MEPKNQDPNNPKPFKIYYVGGGDKIDPEVDAWLRSYITDFFSGENVNISFENFLENPDLAALETLDQQVQGDDHPEALDMIMGAYRRHQNNG